MPKSLSNFFSTPDNLRRALIHRSYCNEHPGESSNERLEFLGDSVLSVIISERLYRLFPHSPEGELTARRSFLVQTSSLSQKAMLLKLDSQLLLSKGEAELGGRTNPSLLANTFEAVLGALFIDSGLAACQTFLTQVFPDSELTSDFDTKDPKSRLQELTQGQGLGTPVYQTVTATGPDHAKTFLISVAINNRAAAEGRGASKQKAEAQAAKAALHKLFPNL